MPVVHSIQHLRALAALGVVAAHLEIYLQRLGQAVPWPHFLSYGVDLFFVISGFIMWVTTAGKPVTPRAFLVKRLARIAPLYWAVTAFALLVLLTNRSLMPAGALDWGHVLASFLFLPAIHPVSGELQPLVTAGWTLNFEMFFYVLFALALFLPERLRLGTVLAMLTLTVALGAFKPAATSPLAFFSDNIILEFGLGMLVGAGFVGGKRLPASLGLAAIAVGLAGWMIGSEFFGRIEPRVLLVGIPAALIVLGAVILEQNGRAPQSRLLHLFGDASYSIYLTHGIVLSAFTRFWTKLVPPGLATSVAAFSMAGFLIASLAGLIVYALFEKPVGRLLSSRKPEIAPKPQRVALAIRVP
ncbi:MAG: acyltransferase [Methylobacterium sp.]|nr:MAG: acyltransferase [Methylobacterium sp.]